MNVVGYIRLSRDEDKENFTSIETQQAIINGYAEKRNWTVSKFYIDDNYSGYTLDRPAFIEMKKEIDNGNIDVIIAKDLSRIGRRNGMVGNLIEQFQDRGNRLILVTEGNDGFDILEDNDDILGIKTWYNEMYIKDISKKIRSSMSAKQKNGELIMGNYYGYKKVKINEKFQFIVDEEIKPAIELIFKSYINGMGYKKICDILDENGFLTPSEYIKHRHESNGRVFKNAVTNMWQTHMIQRIIKDDIYIGNFRTKKKQARKIKGKQERVPENEQYIFYNHHEAIISKEDFELAQQINNRKRETNYRNKAKYDYIFTGFVECADCGYIAVGLNLAKRPKEKRGYNCTMYQRYGKQKCNNHAVTEEKLLFFFKEFLKDVRMEYVDYINNIDLITKKSDISNNLIKARKELNIANEELKLLLTQKIKDLMKETNAEYRQIVEDSYNQVENEKKGRISDLSYKVSQLEKLDNNDIEKEVKTTIGIFDRIIEDERPKQKLLELVLDKILLHEDRSLEFKLKISIDKLTYKDI